MFRHKYELNYRAITSLVIMQICTYIGVMPIVLFFLKQEENILGNLIFCVVGSDGVSISNG